MRRIVYSYVKKEGSLYKGVCISAAGNLYCEKMFATYDEANHNVTQIIKSLLNSKHPNELWYDLQFVDYDIPEIYIAWGNHYEFSNPSLKDIIIFKIKVMWLRMCIIGRWLLNKE